MKKCLIILCLCLNTLFVKQTQGAVTAYLSYAVFENPGQGPYLETYLSFIGSSVKPVKNENGVYQGQVEVEIRFLQAGEIKNAKKYVLNSPEVSTSGLPNFIDQQRFVLANGDYIMETTIADKNAENEQPATTKTNVHVEISEKNVAISDIQLLESYTKSTNPSIITKSFYDLVPYVSNFYPENLNTIKFYSEIYHLEQVAGAGKKMLVTYFIESAEKHLKKQDFAAFKKITADNVNVIIGEFNIDNLPSGNYNLVIQVRDEENKLLNQKRSFFQRLNKEISPNRQSLETLDISQTFVQKYTNKDSLAEFIRCLRPISGYSEIEFAENVIKEPKITLMQQFFYNFWESRNDKNPEAAWLEYQEEVTRVNKEFTTYGLKGYDSDRGRVYLQYGPPDSRNAVTTEPSAAPYEIWQYNTLVNKSLLLSTPYNRQSNKRFVFYNPALVSNNYKLIHSDARGEVVDLRWELRIYKRTVTSNDLDQERVYDQGYGGNVNDNYKNPK